LSCRGGDGDGWKPTGREGAEREKQSHRKWGRNKKKKLEKRGGGCLCFCVETGRGGEAMGGWETDKQTQQAARDPKPRNDSLKPPPGACPRSLNAATLL